MSRPVHSSPRDPNPAPSARWKQLAKKLSLLFGTLLALALVLEAGTRLFTDIIPLTVRDPVLGKRYRRSFQKSVYEPESGRDIFMRFNDVGFRGPDRPLTKPEGVRRVAVLGDSMIAALEVEEQDTLVHLLEQMLNESNPEITWEVMNFGVAGASPGQEIVLYRELVSRFDPDIVICGYFAGNDLADNCNRLSHNPRIYFDFDEDGSYQQLPYAVSRARFSQFLNRHSRFYVWQKQMASTLVHSARSNLQVFHPGAWIFCTQAPEKVSYAWKLTEAAINTLHRDVVDRGGQFVLVMIPSAHQVYRDLFEELAAIDEMYTDCFDWDNPDVRIGEICRRLGVPYLSLTEDFRAAAPSRSRRVKEEWLFHNGNGHFNEQGNGVGARAVHRFLTRGDTDRGPGDEATTSNSPG